MGSPLEISEGKKMIRKIMNLPSEYDLKNQATRN